MLPISLAVVGGRDLHHNARMRAAIDAIRQACTVVRLVSGGARGADSLAERYAREHGLPIDVLPADWAGQGRGAGLARNKEIVARADYVLAFWDGASPGTRNTIGHARRAAGKRLQIVHYTAAPPRRAASAAVKK